MPPHLPWLGVLVSQRNTRNCGHTIGWLAALAVLLTVACGADNPRQEYRVHSVVVFCEEAQVHTTSGGEWAGDIEKPDSTLALAPCPSTERSRVYWDGATERYYRDHYTEHYLVNVTNPDQTPGLYSSLWISTRGCYEQVRNGLSQFDGVFIIDDEYLRTCDGEMYGWSGPYELPFKP